MILIVVRRFEVPRPFPRASCSASEIATVPGTLLVELLFSAGTHVSSIWLVGSLEPQQRGEALGAAGVFSTFGFGRKKYAGHIFRTESEALAERPAEEGLEVQEPRGTRRVEDLNGKESAVAVAIEEGGKWQGSC